MNQPLRLAQGQMLYSDVRHIYGPLSPYINAALYRMFGPSLGVLYVDGMLSAALILALTYWLARRLMGPAGSAAATLSVMWLCAFKQAGNYILPYSYSALHGCMLGLLSLSLLVKSALVAGSAGEEATAPAVDRQRKQFGPRQRLLFASGLLAGLTVLAKTEMGLAALVAGSAMAAMSGYPRLRRALVLAIWFLAPALMVVIAVYAVIAHRAGWDALAHGSFLFFNSLPPALVYFNKRISGFDQPVQSVILMLVAAFRLASLAAVVAAVGLLVKGRVRREPGGQLAASPAGGTEKGLVNSTPVWLLLGGALVVFLSVPVAGAIGWDKGPYLAMPLLLVALLFIAAGQARSDVNAAGSIKPASLVLLVIVIYALASLARVLLRVRSGGAYSSYLLPASVILFTYAWVDVFAGRFRDARVGGLVRQIWIGLILADVVATAPLLAHRFRQKNTYRLSTPRGTMIAVPDIGQAFEEAIKFISNETRPGDPVAVLPEGTSLDFFTGRRNPLREEITTPGYLDDEGEARAIKQLEESNTRIVLVTNRPTPEFGATVVGRDYSRTLMAWVEENFEQVANFGPDKTKSLEVGDKTFFIRAYRRRNSN